MGNQVRASWGVRPLACSDLGRTQQWYQWMPVRSSREDGQQRSQEVPHFWGVPRRICSWNLRLSRKPHEKQGVEMKHLRLTEEATHQRLNWPSSWFLPCICTWESTHRKYRSGLGATFPERRTLGRQFVSGTLKGEYWDLCLKLWHLASHLNREGVGLD